MSQHRGRNGCKVAGVSRETCYLRFGQRTAVIVGSKELPQCTVRGEMVVLDLDAEGRIVGIELVGAGKPCQETHGEPPDEA